MSSKHCGHFGNGSLVVSCETKSKYDFLQWVKFCFRSFFVLSKQSSYLKRIEEQRLFFLSLKCILFSLWTNVYVSFRMFLYYVGYMCLHYLPFQFFTSWGEDFFRLFFFHSTQYCSSWSNVYTVLSSLDDFTGTGILFRVQGEINVTHDIFYKFFFFQDTSVLNSQVLITRMS